jgi:hypothetical protein
MRFERWCQTWFERERRTRKLIRDGELSQIDELCAFFRSLSLNLLC